MHKVCSNMVEDCSHSKKLHTLENLSAVTP